MKWANLDLENDEQACKIHALKEKMKLYMEHVTKLEVELVRAKQDLGEALNAVYEYEQTAADRELMKSIECNMTFKEGR